MSDISRADVEHLAKLAHISMTEQELEKMAGELAVIVDSVKTVADAVSSAAVSGDVPATSHPLPLTNVFREDVVGEVVTAEQSLSNAPDAEDGRFKVPAILDEESEQGPALRGPAAGEGSER